MQKISMRCDPIALAKRYTQRAPINLAPRPTVRHIKPPLCLHTRFGGIFNPLCGTTYSMYLRNLQELSDRKTDRASAAHNTSKASMITPYPVT